MQHFASAAPLERSLKLRELQTSFVFTTVLAKKCKVRCRCIHSVWGKPNLLQASAVFKLPLSAKYLSRYRHLRLEERSTEAAYLPLCATCLIVACGSLFRDRSGLLQPVTTRPARPAH